MLISDRMTWEEKLAALQAIADTSLRMRKPGDWYVSARSREISPAGHPGMLLGDYGKGITPQDAVYNDWDKIAEASKEGKCTIILNAMGPNRRTVRWNGFMWEDWK